MGTSAGEPASERAAKLRARRKELEELLAAKNEELYKLCVREVQLTGVVPPEAPPSPKQQPPQPPRRRPQPRPPPPPPDPVVRHHSVTAHHNKLYYSPDFPETRNLSRVHETHFSSSHPDITTQYSNMMMSNLPSPHVASDTPLIYQYAAQLKALSPHMSGLPLVVPNTNRKRESSRRNTLQRTQTYHLTSHSDYTNHHVDDISASAQQLYVNTQFHSRQPAESQHSGLNTRRRQYDRYPSPSNSNYQISPISSVPSSVSRSQQMSFGNSTASIYSERSQDLQDRVKEKEWYESSLDSPSNANCAINLSAESYGSMKKTPLHRSPSALQNRSAQDGLNSNIAYSPTPSASANTGSASSPRSHHVPSDVPFESPQNCTVVESGKWIPYREESKPFEMADFYKYSTKYRQNNNGGQKQKPTPTYNPQHNHVQADDVQTYMNREHWKHSHQL